MAPSKQLRTAAALGVAASCGLLALPFAAPRQAATSSPALRASAEAQASSAAASSSAGGVAAASLAAAGVVTGALAVAVGSRRGGRALGARAVAVARCAVTVDESGALPVVKLAKGEATADVYLLGGCVTSYKTGGDDWLFGAKSAAAQGFRPDRKVDGSMPIRGGLHHCFPQFGPGAIQQHGFARNLPWKLVGGDASSCVLELTDNEETRAMWPHGFKIEFEVALEDGQLTTKMTVENTGSDDFFFTTGLHSYYNVSDVNTCAVTGDFKGADKLDMTQYETWKLPLTPYAHVKGTDETVTVTKPTLEIYRKMLPGSVTLSDPARGSLGIVSGGGWKDCVIWNPYGDKNMAFDKFICVESAALDAVALKPKGSWVATMNLVPKLK